MKTIKKGDLLTIRGNETKLLYFTGIFDNFTYCGLPCVFLAEDIENKNTYERYSQQKLSENGYKI